MTSSKHQQRNEMNETHIHCLLYWEKRQAKKNYFVQPLPNGDVVNYT